VDTPKVFTALAKSGANPIAPVDIVTALRAMAGAPHPLSRHAHTDFLNPL